MALNDDFHLRQPISANFVESLTKAAFALIVAYVSLLAVSSWIGVWLTDAQGQVRQNDFVAVWAAGRLVLEGQPANVYDWPVHKAVEELAVGHPFEKYFGWHYPPTFLPVAALLALLPYLVAFFTWLAVTLPAYLTVIRTIVGHRVGIILAGAFPAALWNVSVGQNGFLTAALLGGALVTIEKRPVLAGILLGLLTYKPQLGILFPLLLAAGGHWRVFGVATLTALTLVAGSWAHFGTATWAAFFEQLELTHVLVLNGGLAGFHKLQTILGLVRWLGGSENLAWGVHVSAAVIWALFVVVLWTVRPVAYELKAAAAGTAALIATPYLYVYDLVVLAIPLAFLVRHGLRTRFLPYDMTAIAVVSALVFVLPLVAIPLAPLAFAIVCIMILRHVAASDKTPVTRLFSDLWKLAPPSNRRIPT